MSAEVASQSTPQTDYLVQSYALSDFAQRGSFARDVVALPLAWMPEGLDTDHGVVTDYICHGEAEGEALRAAHQLYGLRDGHGAIALTATDTDERGAVGYAFAGVVLRRGASMERYDAVILDGMNAVPGSEEVLPMLADHLLEQYPQDQCIDDPKNTLRILLEGMAPHPVVTEIPTVVGKARLALHDAYGDFASYEPIQPPGENT